MNALALVLVVIGVILVVLGVLSLLGGSLAWGLIELIIGLVVIALSRNTSLRL